MGPSQGSRSDNQMAATQLTGGRPALRQGRADEGDSPPAREGARLHHAARDGVQFKT